MRPAPCPRARLAAATAAAALAGVALTASPADAHTSLISSDPAKGSVVSSPAQIRLTYAEPVRFPGVVLTDAKGGHHELAKPSIAGNNVVQQVAGVLTPGVYAVGWRVVSDDGHPVTGRFTFTVKSSGTGGTSAAPSTASTEYAGPATARPAAQTASNGSSAGWWWIGLAVLVVATAGGGFALVRRRG